MGVFSSRNAIRFVTSELVLGLNLSHHTSWLRLHINVLHFLAILKILIVKMFLSWVVLILRLNEYFTRSMIWRFSLCLIFRQVYIFLDWEHVCSSSRSGRFFCLHVVCCFAFLTILFHYFSRHFFLSLNLFFVIILIDINFYRIFIRCSW